MRQKLGSTVNIAPAFAAKIVYVAHVIVQSVNILYCDYTVVIEDSASWDIYILRSEFCYSWNKVYSSTVSVHKQMPHNEESLKKLHLEVCS
jgi:hypothetical protein